MKTLTLIVIMAVSVFATAATQKNITVKKAVLNICPVTNEGRPLKMGCSDRLQINKAKAVLFDLHTSASDEVENCMNSVIGTSRFHKITKSQSFTVVGFMTKEKGRFPNPMAEFEVFHIVDSNICTLPLPR